MTIAKTTLLQMAQEAAGRNENVFRMIEDMLGRLDGLEASIGTVADGETALADRVTQAEADIDTLEGYSHTTRLAYHSTINLADTNAVDTGTDWPDTVYATDLYLFIGNVNGRIAQIVQGDQVQDLDAGTAGSALAAAERVTLYQVGTSTARAYIGSSVDDGAGGNILLAGVAADADASLAIYRILSP